jgi:hypothetical protein
VTRRARRGRQIGPVCGLVLVMVIAAAVTLPVAGVLFGLDRATALAAWVITVVITWVLLFRPRR